MAVRSIHKTAEERRVYISCGGRFMMKKEYHRKKKKEKKNYHKKKTKIFFMNKKKRKKAKQNFHKKKLDRKEYKNEGPQEDFKISRTSKKKDEGGKSINKR